jgi:hypothetical protein
MRSGTLSRAEIYFQLKVTIAPIDKAKSTLAFKKNMSLDSRSSGNYFSERSRNLRAYNPALRFANGRLIGLFELSDPNH